MKPRTTLKLSFFLQIFRALALLLATWTCVSCGRSEAVVAGVPEPDGSMLYFELTDSVACQCDPARDTLKDISWSKVKEGFGNLERLYGTVNVKNNRYA